MAYWIGVASKDHVEAGATGGFCQLCHGKASAVRRLSPGDWIAYYSPRSQMKGGETVQAFTAIGRVKPGEPYAFDMGNGFVPARRNVNFHSASDAPIRPLIDRLSFIKNKSNWAYPFRFGFLKVTKSDFATIAEAMGLDPDLID
jgi:hypothetical protein